MNNKQHNISPRFIYFTGVDGSGKSTVIDLLINEYQKKGINARKVWLRFNYFFTKPILFLCRIIGLTRRERRGNRIISVHDFHRSKLIAFLVQYLHFIDTLTAYIIKVWIPLRFTNCVIFCDKFVYDILADFMVETKDLNLLDKKITKLFLRLIPKDTPLILFTVEKEEIIRRKPEVLLDDEDYDLKYKAYQIIMKKLNLKIIKNDDFENTVLKVKEAIADNKQ